MTVHSFEPRRYYTAIGPYEPALRMADGDDVITHTVDAAGADASGEVITPRGNPMTGLFYVDGAMPGDTLAVTFDYLYPDRDTGWAYSVVAENVVEPGFVRELPAKTRLEWRLDRERGTAELTQPPAGLEGLVLPMDPMLGCFGVAPGGGQTIATDTSGPHGGNMDYRGFRAGVTVYLPIFVPGALFFLGDGHAVQGDGEIVGTGVEASFEVRFSVRVLHGMRSGWPRGEDAEYIFTVGNARPLDQAVQHATTEMLRWLGTDYGLDLRAASTLLGQAAAYDLGNIFDPAYTMVCKVPKRLLRPMPAGARG
jgi:amidase